MCGFKCEPTSADFCGTLPRVPDDTAVPHCVRAAIGRCAHIYHLCARGGRRVRGIGLICSAVSEGP
eukprot:4326046-Prymnesium_polylepis.1